MSRTEPLNDFDDRLVTDAESDLDRLFAIEPSPEFAAKVRARIAEERTNRSRWTGWIGVLATVGAAAIVGVMLRSDLYTDPERSAFSTPAHADIVLKTEREEEPKAVAPVVSAPTATAREVRRAASPPQQAEIIIDPAVSDAIRRLAIAARNTTLDGSKGESIAAPNSEYETLPIAKPLDVPELALRPADETGDQ